MIIKALYLGVFQTVTMEALKFLVFLIKNLFLTEDKPYQLQVPSVLSLYNPCTIP